LCGKIVTTGQKQKIGLRGVSYSCITCSRLKQKGAFSIERNVEIKMNYAKRNGLNKNEILKKKS